MHIDLLIQIYGQFPQTWTTQQKREVLLCFLEFGGRELVLGFETFLSGNRPHEEDSIWQKRHKDMAKQLKRSFTYVKQPMDVVLRCRRTLSYFLHRYGEDAPIVFVPYDDDEDED